MKTQYGAASDHDNGGFLAGAFLVLKSGFCPFVTVTLDGFDTHSNQITTHKPVMEEFAASLLRSQL